MVFGKKVDYPPLLGPGRHEMSLMDIRAMTMDAFEGNLRRRNLYYKLEEFVQAYLKSGLICEIWINGSFLTKKPDPGDVDATVIVGSEIELTPEQEELIERTMDDEFYPDIDAFAYQFLEKEHPGYHDELLNPALTWYEMYGIENSQEWLKGFAVIKLRETNVGLFRHR